MADRNLDHGNAPPATTAQQQHLINLRRMYPSRYGDISNCDGFVPPQFGGAAPEDFSAANGQSVGMIAAVIPPWQCVGSEVRVCNSRADRCRGVAAARGSIANGHGSHSDFGAGFFLLLLRFA